MLLIVERSYAFLLENIRRSENNLEQLFPKLYTKLDSETTDSVRTFVEIVATQLPLAILGDLV